MATRMVKMPIQGCHLRGINLMLYLCRIPIVAVKINRISVKIPKYSINGSPTKLVCSSIIFPPKLLFCPELCRKATLLINLRKEDDVVFAVSFGAFGAGSVGKIQFFDFLIFLFHIFFHLLCPFASILIWSLKNFG